MIGIHDRPGSFSDRWIAYCTNKRIPFRRVNCGDTDIMRQCEGLDGILWHWSHYDPADILVSRQVIASLEAKGLAVFPNIRTCWHFDDKVAQKYLLEAIRAPLIPTWVFTSEAEAVRWIDSASWPKVFKLRCGAGAANVRMVSSHRQAAALCHRAFARGFPAVGGYFTDIKSRVRKSRTARDFWARLARAPHTFLNVLSLNRHMPRERGYVLFQEFLPGNDHDTRITIIGNRAFAFMRQNRPNDFRASGSGSIIYDKKIDERCIKIAFEVAKQIGSQSVAFDFLYGPYNQPMIGEMSYCYLPSAVHDCPGHWDSTETWHDGNIWPEEAILEDFLATCRQFLE